MTPVLVITLSTAGSRHSGNLDSPANWPLDWSLALDGFQQGSLLSENTHTGITALGPHGRHHFPVVDDGVIALDAAQQGVPIVAEWGEAEGGNEHSVLPHACPTLRMPWRHLP